jgi:hypothetical protein
MPTKKRRAIKPLGVVTRPAIAVGIEPQSKRPMKTSRGPKRSHSGPAMNRTRNLCSSACLIQKELFVRYLRSQKSNNVRVCDLLLCHMKIFANGHR